IPGQQPKGGNLQLIAPQEGCLPAGRQALRYAMILLDLHRRQTQHIGVWLQPKTKYRESAQLQHTQSLSKRLYTFIERRQCKLGTAKSADVHSDVTRIIGDFHTRDADNTAFGRTFL